jgi:hypothetical protein
MRSAIVVGGLAVAIWVSSAADANAQYRRVCAVYEDRSMLCYYDNFRQCREAVFGLRADCIVNPEYDPVLDRRSR